MSLKHTWTQSVKDDAGSAVAVDSAHDVLGDGEFKANTSIDVDSTVEVDTPTIDKDLIQSIYIWSNKALTINTNAVDASGGQTIALEANRAFAWNVTMPYSNPITQDITALFAINEALTGTAATLRVGILLQTA